MIKVFPISESHRILNELHSINEASTTLPIIAKALRISMGYATYNGTDKLLSRIRKCDLFKAHESLGYDVSYEDDSIMRLSKTKLDDEFMRRNWNRIPRYRDEIVIDTNEVFDPGYILFIDDIPTVRFETKFTPDDWKEFNVKNNNQLIQSSEDPPALREFLHQVFANPDTHGWVAALCNGV